MNQNKVLPIVIGTEIFSGDWGIPYDAEKVSEILHFAGSEGVVHVDTAASYGGDHYVEKLLGEVLSTSRVDFKVASKFYLNLSGNSRGLPITSVSEMDRELNRTLRSLQTSYLDTYYFHSGADDFFFQDAIWEFLNKQVRAGVIRNLGLSISHSLTKERNYQQVLGAQNYGISKIQTVLNLVSKEALDFVIPFCRDQGIEILGRMPLAKGLLSGRYSMNSTFDERDPRGRAPELTQEILRGVAAFKGEISVSHAVRWATERVDKIVVGTKNKEQLAGIIAALR